MKRFKIGVMEYWNVGVFDQSITLIKPTPVRCRLSPS